MQIANDNLSNSAYERIRAEIAEGQLPPTVIIREVDLVRDYGMSRTPIREALNRLEGVGLIRRVASGGYVAVELGPKEFSDIYQVREVLVGLAAKLAATNRTRVDVAHLDDALDAVDRAIAMGLLDEADGHIRRIFHLIASASGNDYLHTTLGRLTDVFRYKALAVTHPEWRDMLRAQLKLLRDVIVAREPERAERIGRELIAKSLAIRLRDFPNRESVEPPGA